MENLIIIANLGWVRSVKFKPAGDDPADKAHLFEEAGSMVEIRPKMIHQTVTDSAGRFSQGGAVGRRTGMSNGEEHHMEDELQRQTLQRVATRIDEIVAVAGYPAWRLVIPHDMLPKLLTVLPARAHQSLSKSVSGDLTKLPLAELEKRLLSGN